MNPYLRSLARFPMQAAFRYHKQPNETPALALEWTRFPDSSVLAAVAERAVVTTLVTTEGRSLTEIKLTIKKSGAAVLESGSASGCKHSLRRSGRRKSKTRRRPRWQSRPAVARRLSSVDSYIVSFVFIHSGSPFAKKGGSDLSLPKMDVPINLLQWEVFLPEQYKVKDFGGDAIAANLLPASGRDVSGAEEFGQLSVTRGYPEAPTTRWCLASEPAGRNYRRPIWRCRLQRASHRHTPRYGSYSKRYDRFFGPLDRFQFVLRSRQRLPPMRLVLIST